MKYIRKTSLLLYLFIFLFVIFANAKVEASSIPSWEFYPITNSYLDPENVIYIERDEGMICSIKTVSPIKVKSGKPYAFYLKQEHDGYITDFTLEGYDKNGRFTDQLDVIRLQGECGHRVFQIPQDVQYIKFRADIQKKEGSNLYLDVIAYNYFLIEYSDTFSLSNTNVSELMYKGPNLDNYQILGGEARYVTYMSNPIDFSVIDSYVEAYDNYDGHLTNKKVIEKNEYDENNKAGIYNVNYSAIDKAGNKGTFNLQIHLIDDVKPEISGNSKYVIGHNQGFTLDKIKENLTAIDNNDGDITNKITVKSEDFSTNEAIPGNYTAVFEVKDNAENTTTYTVNINVYNADTEAPEFDGQFTFNVNSDEIMTLDDILEYITAYDNEDGDVTDSITVEYDEYSDNLDKIGKYTVTLSVSDESGNKATQIVTINVIDKVSPIFMFNSKNIYVEVGTASIESIALALQKTNNMFDSDYEVIYDEFSENKNNPGSYRVIYKNGTSEIRVNVNVEKELFNINENLTILDRIIIFFRNSFDIIRDAITKFFS